MNSPGVSGRGFENRHRVQIARGREGKRRSIEQSARERFDAVLKRRHIESGIKQNGFRASIARVNQFKSASRRLAEGVVQSCHRTRTYNFERSARVSVGAIIGDLMRKQRARREATNERGAVVNGVIEHAALEQARYLN